MVLPPVFALEMLYVLITPKVVPTQFRYLWQRLSLDPLLQHKYETGGFSV